MPAVPGSVTLVDLPKDGRERAVPVLIDSFVGIYRWHAKRTLREVQVVRGAEIGGALAGIAMLERLVPDVGYVYYIAVASAHRRRGSGDDCSTMPSIGSDARGPASSTPPFNRRTPPRGRSSSRAGSGSSSARSWATRRVDWARGGFGAGCGSSTGSCFSVGGWTRRPRGRAVK